MQNMELKAVAERPPEFEVEAVGTILNSGQWFKRIVDVRLN